MTIESTQLLPQLTNDIDLLQEYLVQILSILLHIRPRLVYLIQQVHLVLDHTDHLINMTSMGMYQLFLFFEDLLNQLLMVIAQVIS